MKHSILLIRATLSLLLFAGTIAACSNNKEKTEKDLTQERLELLSQLEKKIDTLDKKERKEVFESVLKRRPRISSIRNRHGNGWLKNEVRKRWHERDEDISKAAEEGKLDEHRSKVENAIKSMENSIADEKREKVKDIFIKRLELTKNLLEKVDLLEKK